MLPIFGVTCKNLKEYTTKKKDVQNGVTKIPSLEKRIEEKLRAPSVFEKTAQLAELYKKKKFNQEQIKKQTYFDSFNSSNSSPSVNYESESFRRRGAEKH